MVRFAAGFLLLSLAAAAVVLVSAQLSDMNLGPHNDFHNLASELLHDWVLGFSKQITQQPGADAKDDLVQNTAAGVKTQAAAAEVKQVSLCHSPVKISVTKTD